MFDLEISKLSLANAYLYPSYIRRKKGKPLVRDRTIAMA